MGEFLTELIGEYAIYQDPEGYRFSQDSVLLANLASVKPGDKVIDLGSGCGVIGFLIAIKKSPEKVLCVELDPRASELCEKSIKLNKLENKISSLNSDIREPGGEYAGAFDKAVCNPPYYALPPARDANSGKAAAKFEGEATLDDFVCAASRALKFGGDLFIIHKADRLCDLFISLRKNMLEPKKIINVYPKPGANADTVVISARKGGKSGLISEQLTVTDGRGNYTERIKELYR